LNNIHMEQYGAGPRFLGEATLYTGEIPARVVSQSRDLYRVVCEEGFLAAEVSGKFRFETKYLSDYPAVGDFVMLDRSNDENGNAIIHHLLTRKSAFIRKAAGTAGEEQVVAANIDVVFLCMALNRDFNLRRMERYLAVAWDSGATPVIVLTKADLCDDVEARLRETETVAPGVEILVSSSVEKDGYLKVMEYIRPGQTVALMGSSGVGKSTLINCLLGEERITTKGLRNDDKGKHTTTKRELFLLPNGGLVIDTPGMRELGLESADLGKAFSDIDALAAQCRFRDCTHGAEPGCAVRKALEEGSLSSERLENYFKLKKEARYEGLNFREIESTKMEEMFRDVGGMKNARRLVKEKTKRREGR